MKKKVKPSKVTKVSIAADPTVAVTSINLPTAPIDTQRHSSNISANTSRDMLLAPPSEKNRSQVLLVQAGAILPRNISGD